jgi:hypothetical protein
VVESVTEWTPSDDQKRRLYEFVGYGAEDPRVVFIGLEEYCPAASQHENVRLRCEAPVFGTTRCDKRNATLALFGEAGEQLLRPHAVPVWSTMACMMGAIRGSDSDTEYRRLGADAGDTLLTELLPLPRPNVSEWDATYIPSWFGFRSFAAYSRAVRPERLKRLRGLLREKMPPLVFCYGTSQRRSFEDLFGLGPDAWQEPHPGIERAEVWGSTTVVLTPFYGRLNAAARGTLFSYCAETLRGCLG